MVGLAIPMIRLVQEERRSAVCRDTLPLVDQHNAAGEAGVPVARMGINGLVDIPRSSGTSFAAGQDKRGIRVYVAFGNSN